MARIRTIKPEFWGDPKTARCSRDARLLFLGMLNESDDEGRQLGNPRRIAGAIFPNDEDVTQKLVTKWLDELEKARYIARYDVDGVPYIHIIGFAKHQKISHATPSRLPEPPEQFRNGSGETPEILPKNSGEAPEQFRPDLGSGSRNSISKRSAPETAVDNCPRCQGRGHYWHAGAGADITCECVNERSA